MPLKELIKSTDIQRNRSLPHYSPHPRNLVSAKKSKKALSD